MLGNGRSMRQQPSVTTPPGGLLLTREDLEVLSRVAPVVTASAGRIGDKVIKRLASVWPGKETDGLHRLAKRPGKGLERWVILSVLPSNGGPSQARLRHLGRLLAKGSIPPGAVLAAFWGVHEGCTEVLRRAAKRGCVEGVPLDLAVSVIGRRLAGELMALLSALPGANGDSGEPANGAEAEQVTKITLFAQAISRELEDVRVMEILADRVAEEFKPDGVVIHSLEQEGTLATPVTVLAGKRTALPSNEYSRALQADWRLCRVLRTGCRFHVYDASTTLTRCSSQVHQQARGSYCCIPLAGGTHVFGCLHLSWNRPNALSSGQLDMLSLYGQVVGMSLRSLDLLRLNRRSATTDPLTGLSNMRNFRRILDKEQLLLLRRGGRASVLAIDVDGLKKINELHGNEAGDRLLQSLAGMLKAAVRRTDELARLGGDEFVILLRDCGPEDALSVAEKIAARVAAFRVLMNEDTSISATVCVGVVGSPLHARRLPDALPLAEAALRRAKKSGPGSTAMGELPSSVATTA